MAISNNSTGLRTGVCTSSTRPTAPYNGQVIYETDTSLSSVWNGSTWVGTTSAATTANGNGGHSNIYSNSLSTSTATVVSAVRRVRGVTYVFTNLTFNMPTNANTDASDWTSGTKWSYIYIRPTDNKFYISNTAPAAGLNYKTIGGSLVVYLFPIYATPSVITPFDLSNNKYSLFGNPRSTYDTYETGLGIRYDWGSNQTVTFDASAVIPTTAGNVYTAFRRSTMGRNDGGGSANVSQYLEIQNKSGTWGLVGQQYDWIYTKTPTPWGDYYIRSISSPFEVTLSRDVHNFAQCRYSWYGNLNDNSGYNGFGWWMKGFDDVNIF